jgi:hypothetical protein
MCVKIGLMKIDKIKIDALNSVKIHSSFSKILLKLCDAIYFYENYRNIRGKFLITRSK